MEKDTFRADFVADRHKRLETRRSLKLKKRMRIKQIKAEALAKIREVNIEYTQSPERLQAKYATLDRVHSEKRRKRIEAKIERKRAFYEKQFSQRQFTGAEELTSAIIQGVGTVFFIVATVLLNLRAVNRVALPSEKLAFTLFYTILGVSMALNYLCSTLHHALFNIDAKEVFKRICRALVFFSIMTGFGLYSFRQLVAVNFAAIFCVSAAAAIGFTGIIMYAISGSYHEKVNIILYAVLGVLALVGFFIFGDRNLPHSAGIFFVSGGIYLVGIVCCSLNRLKFMHVAGDVLLLFASVLLFGGMFI